MAHADALFTIARRLENPRGIDHVANLAFRSDGCSEAYVQRPTTALGLHYYPQVLPPVTAEESIVPIFQSHVPPSWGDLKSAKKGEALTQISRTQFEMASTICFLDSLGGSPAPVRFNTRGFLPIAFSGA